MSTTTQPAVRESNGRLAEALRIRPAVDLVENENDFLMHVEMPGVDHSTVEVAIEKNVVTITGRADLSPPAGYELVAGEPGRRIYERSFQVSDDIDAAIDAEVKNGVLTLRFPKSKKAQRTSIPVKGA